MSVSAALQDWKELAASAAELTVLQRKVGEMQAAHFTARMEFESELEALEEEEREAILSIMAIYDQHSQADPTAADVHESAGRGSVLSWLVNKVGNEGTEGVAWGSVLQAWHTQYPDSPTSTVYTELHRHPELFVKTGLGEQAVLRLTTQGQALFRGGK